MQHYSNLSNCIKMCERMLNSNERSIGTGVTYSKYNFRSKFDQNEVVSKTYVKRGRLRLFI